MDAPIKFIYYIKKKIKNINNKINSLKNDFENYKNENNLFTNNIKSDYLSLKIEIEQLKMCYNNLLEDMVQSQNFIVKGPSWQHSQEYKVNQYDKAHVLNILSENLSEFLDVDSNYKMTLTNVMKRIFNYIEDNKLRNVLDKRLIKPDDKLRELLRIKKNTVLTYANIQQFVEPMLKPITNIRLNI